MAIKFTNNASAELASSISSSATTITVASGQGALFPTLGAGDYFYATLIDASNNLEIIKVTGRSGDVMTAVRGQDGTTSQAFVGGDKLELRPTAAALADVASGMNITNLPAGTELNGVDIVDTSSAQTLTNKTLTSPSMSSPSMTGTPTAPTAAGGTNNTQIATTAFVQTVAAGLQAFPSGTKMIFAQTAAPTGWAKDTTHNDKALRVVNGSASSGGSMGFTSAFTVRSVTGTVGSTTLSTSQIPAHSHQIISSSWIVGSNSSFTGTGAPISAGGKSSTGPRGTFDTGGNGSHSHSFGGSNMDFSVAYVDVIIAVKL